MITFKYTGARYQIAGVVFLCAGVVLTLSHHQLIFTIIGIHKAVNGIKKEFPR